MLVGFRGLALLMLVGAALVRAAPAPAAPPSAAPVTAPVTAPASPPAAAPSCAEDPAFRQQDFLLGRWTVYRQGKVGAVVLMERALGGCAVHETWTTEGGRPGSGLGLFTYSRAEGRWHYLWAADTGSATAFTGHEIRPGEMRYDTVRPLPDGRSRLRRWSLVRQPDGRIREWSVGSEDGGATWTTEYDLMWVRIGD